MPLLPGDLKADLDAAIAADDLPAVYRAATAYCSSKGLGGGRAIDLATALEICLVYLQHPDREVYHRACERWLNRNVTEMGISQAERGLAGAALQAIAAGQVTMGCNALTAMYADAALSFSDRVSAWYQRRAASQSKNVGHPLSELIYDYVDWDRKPARNSITGQLVGDK